MPRVVRARPAPPQLLVSEYIVFPTTLNTTIPLNFCLVYDFMPSPIQALMRKTCMVK